MVTRARVRGGFCSDRDARREQGRRAGLDVGAVRRAGAARPRRVRQQLGVPPEESERFLRRWKDNARIMAGQPGFIGARMYRSLVDDVELRFINVAQWDSGKALDAARANPEWRTSMKRVLDDPDLHVTPRPVVYQVAIDVHPATRCDPTTFTSRVPCARWVTRGVAAVATQVRRAGRPRTRHRTGGAVWVPRTSGRTRPSQPTRPRRTAAG